MPTINNFPKLHNAAWPGVVGKGPDSEPPIDLVLKGGVHGDVATVAIAVVGVVLAAVVMACSSCSGWICRPRL